MDRLLILFMVGVISFSGISCSGVENGTDAGRIQDIQTSESVNTMGGSPNMELIDDLVVQNTQILMNQLAFEDIDAVAGAADRLVSVGCGEIASIEVIDDSDEVYSLKLIDKQNLTYFTTISHEGYIGPIQDNDNNYLYAPVD